jgi:hypothetical protein
VVVDGIVHRSGRPCYVEGESKQLGVLPGSPPGYDALASALEIQRLRDRVTFLEAVLAVQDALTDRPVAP